VPAGAEQAYATVRAAGEEEEIPFAFDEITVSANTLDAHRLIRWAGSLGLPAQHQMVELLFKAYFEDGKSLGDDAVLIEAAEQVGLEAPVVERLLSGDADRDTVAAEIDQARQMGVTACALLHHRHAVRGRRRPVGPRRWPMPCARSFREKARQAAETSN
jgi:predicted DsbA family dithiol-disulfide isomerase